MQQGQIKALQARVLTDVSLREKLWSASCLDEAAVICREAGFKLQKSDFLEYMRKAIAEGSLRYIPYRDDTLGLSDEEVDTLFKDQPRTREIFVALSIRFRQDPELRIKLRGAVNLDDTTKIAREAGFDLSKQDWLQYLRNQLRAGMLRLVPWGLES